MVKNWILTKSVNWVFTEIKQHILRGELMRANYDYYNHKYYNYDYEDLRTLSFSLNSSEKISMTSRVYPTKLEVKIDENSNIPYLYYEGVVRTNKGMCKIVFPKLEMSLDCIQTQATENDTSDCLRYKYIPRITQYHMTTKFNNISRDDVMYELYMFNEDDYKNFGDHVNKM